MQQVREERRGGKGDGGSVYITKDLSVDRVFPKTDIVGYIVASIGPETERK